MVKFSVGEQEKPTNKMETYSLYSVLVKKKPQKTPSKKKNHDENVEIQPKANGVKPSKGLEKKKSIIKEIKDRVKSPNSKKSVSPIADEKQQDPRSPKKENKEEEREKMQKKLNQQQKDPSTQKQIYKKNSEKESKQKVDDNMKKTEPLTKTKNDQVKVITVKEAENINCSKSPDYPSSPPPQRHQPVKEEKEQPKQQKSPAKQKLQQQQPPSPKEEKQQKKKNSPAKQKLQQQQPSSPKEEKQQQKKNSPAKQKLQQQQPPSPKEEKQQKKKNSPAKQKLQQQQPPSPKEEKQQKKKNSPAKQKLQQQQPPSPKEEKQQQKKKSPAKQKLQQQQQRQNSPVEQQQSTQQQKIFKRTIAINTDPYVPEQRKKPKMVDNKTSTQDLFKPIKTDSKEVQTEMVKDNPGKNPEDYPESHKIIVVPTKLPQSDSWKPHDQTIKDSHVPPTPEGPRFQQDGTQLTYTHPGVQQDILIKLHTLQTQGLMCDVYIRVDGIDFKAHKIVLAASSPYFSELFRNINTVRVDRLILEGLKPQSVAAMLGYFYMAKLIIDVEDVEDLIDAAHYFKTMEVVKLCTNYLELQLGLHNCINFYIIAHRHEIEGLRLKAFRYICWNFKSIVKERPFIEISGDILLQIISSKEVKVKMEEEIYEAVWSWYVYNKIDRGFFLSKLVMQIHFELMVIEYLKVKVKKEMYLESEMCRKKVDDAINVIENNVDIDSRKLSSYRQASDNIYIFSHKPNTCEMLDLMTGAVNKLPELYLPSPMVDLDCHVTVKAGHTLYTVSRSKVVAFNPSRLAWEYYCKGIVEIADSGICSTKTSIYVIGGRPDGKQFFELNLVTKEWTKLLDMEQDRRLPAVASMGNTKPRIYAAGGFSPSKCCVLDTMEYYTSIDKIWKMIKKPMKVPRLQAGMITTGDRVMIVGGRSEEKDHNTLDIFDRCAQKWTKNSCHLSETKVDPCLIMFEAKIYCVGGNSCNTIEVLEEDGKRQKWNIVSKLRKPIKHAKCVVYNPL